MSKILKIVGDEVTVGLDNGTLKVVNRNELSFSPNINDEVEVFQSDDMIIINKKETNTNQNVNINVSNVNNTGNVAKVNKEFHPGGVPSWFFGILLMLSGLGNVIGNNIAFGLIFLLVGCIILPPVTNFFYKKFNIKLTAGKKVLLFFIAFIISTIIIGITATDQISNNDTTKVEETKNVKEVAVLNVGESITCSNFEITLKDAYITKSFKIPYSNMFLERTYTAEENKDYALLKVSVKNIGTSTDTFNGTYDTKYIFKLVGNNTYEYYMSSLDIGDYSFLSEVRIEPLETKTIYIFGDFPSEAATENLVAKMKVEGKEFNVNIK